MLIATGVSDRQLEIPGLDRLTGAGVYYGSVITEESFLLANQNGCRNQTGRSDKEAEDTLPRAVGVWAVDTAASVAVWQFKPSA
jgi:hypothetical protein